MSNHPTLTHLLTPEDLDALNFLTDLRIEQSGDATLSGVKFIFVSPFTFERKKKEEEKENFPTRLLLLCIILVLQAQPVL